MERFHNEMICNATSFTVERFPPPVGFEPTDSELSRLNPESPGLCSKTENYVI